MKRRIVISRKNDTAKVFDAFLQCSLEEIRVEQITDQLEESIQRLENINKIRSKRLSIFMPILSEYKWVNYVEDESSPDEIVLLASNTPPLSDSDLIT